MSRLVAPGFWNVEEFARDVMWCSQDHVRHAARSYVDNDAPRSRAKLPEGFGAFMWAGVYIVFDLDDADAINRLFGVKVRLPNV